MADGDGHERFEELAVGHVLGGLATGDAALFRSHLLECRDCRMRVAELRDIAADLAQAEREERRRAATKTEVARRQQSDASDPRPRWWRPSVLVPAILLLGVAPLLGVLVWNYHLRQNNLELLEATGQREQVVEALASGELVSTELSGDVRGLVAVTDDGGVAINLVGIPERAGEQVFVWLVGEDGPVWREPVVPSAGRLALFMQRRGAPWMVVSLETQPAGDRPGGRVLARAMLRSATPRPTPVPAP